MSATLFEVSYEAWLPASVVEPQATGRWTGRKESCTARSQQFAEGDVLGAIAHIFVSLQNHGQHSITAPGRP